MAGTRETRRGAGWNEGRRTLALFIGLRVEDDQITLVEWKETCSPTAAVQTGLKILRCLKDSEAFVCCGQRLRTHLVVRAVERM